MRSDKKSHENIEKKYFEHIQKLNSHTNHYSTRKLRTHIAILKLVQKFENN